VQEHVFSVDLPAPPAEVWDIFWYRGPDRPQPPPGSGTRIEILRCTHRSMPSRRIHGLKHS